jgi:hypothetical protein
MRATCAVLAGWIGIVAGCSEYKPASPPPSAAPSQPAATAKPAGQPIAGQPSGASGPAQPPAQSGMTAGMTAMGGAIGMAPLETAVGGPRAVPPAGASTRPAAPPTAPTGMPGGGTIVGPAQVGVGEKGRGYGTGPIATPAAAYFAARERIAFEIHIPHAMQLYKASNGSAPKTHQEFEQKILRENRIELPQLRPGEYYQYDPAGEQLMVMKPPS